MQRAVGAVLKVDEGKQQIKTFGEFSAELTDPNSAVSQSVETFAVPFLGFTPARRPVFWRILIAQLFLYRAARLHRVPDLTNSELLKHVELSQEEMKEFAFSHDPSDSAEVTAGYAVGLRFLEASLNYTDPFRS